MEDKDIQLHEFLDQPADPVKSRPPESRAEGGSPERAGGEASLAPQSEAEPEADKKPTAPKDLLPPAADPDPKKPVKKPSTAPRRVLLSKLLKSVPESECVHIFQNWDAAIVEETIRAVPFKGREFSKEIIDLKGKKALIERPDELVELTPPFQTWWAAQREQSRYATLVYVGEIAITSTRDQAEFDHLLKARVQRLKAKQSKTKGGDQ